MDTFVTIILVLAGFTVGLVAGGALSCGVIDDLHALLAHLLADPNDETTRAIVRATLYQEK